MILFLDIDGVLHPEGVMAAAYFQHLPRLEEVLRRHPTVDIVISSTWRESHTLAQLKGRFADDVASRVIDTTPSAPDQTLPMSLLAYRRQAEIETWLRGHQRAWEDWIAIDDKPWLFRPFCLNLIVVPGQTGLTDAHCRLIHGRLGHV
jgi:hypothetical protein